jgi:hypothetical protein
LFLSLEAGIWVGKLKHSKDKIEGIKWSEKPIKTLGVYFGNNKAECEKLNWENKIDKMNTLFFSWGKRNLTFETFTFNFFSIFVWHDTCTSNTSKYRYD